MDDDFKKKAFETVFKERWHVTDEIYEKCISVSDVICFSRGENFIKQGDIQDTLYFVVSGIARGVSYSGESRDLTDCFMYTPGEVIYACNSLTQPRPASVYVNAVTDCVFVTFPRAMLNMILAENQELCLAYIKYMETYLEDCRMLEIIRSRPSVERYAWFCKRHSEIKDILPIHCILSYLDMPEISYRQALAETKQ